MDAGKLDRRIILKHVTTAQDATGEPIRTKANYATIWAQRMEQRLTEVFSAGADQAARTVVWRVRWRGDIVLSDVIESGGIDYEVTAIQELGRRDYFDLVSSNVGASA